MTTETSLQDQLNKLIHSHLEQLSLPKSPYLAYKPFRYVLNLGGKRIRPYCVLLGSGICDGEVEEAISAALAIELLHNFTLVHDDIMDQAETRRGEPSVHNKWNESTAILSGDIIFSRAFRLLHYYVDSDQFDRNTASRIQQHFLDAVDTVCEGQALDLELADRKKVELDEYLTMIEKKTAYLIGSSLSLGGIIAGATQRQYNSLFEIGKKAGIAFQIQDDLLDVIGNPEKFGKMKGGDIREGKKTYLSILALQNVDKNSKKFIHKVLSKKDVNESDVEQLIKLYEDSKVIGKTKQEIQNLYYQTQNLVDQFDKSKYRSELQNLIEQLSQREQ